MAINVRTLASAAIVVVSLAFAQSADAATSLVGTWQTNFSVNGVSCTMQSIYGSDHTYSEELRCGTLMTHQSGTYVFKGGLLVRTVQDWDPKQQWVVDACVGCGHWQTVAKPPGGSYKVTFVSANTATLHDINMGGSLTMHRATS
jgi:hypothetical protein